MQPARLVALIVELLRVADMRASLAILVLALGCAGCRENQTSTREVVAPPVPEPGERPSFYDSSNSAEYYGRCPKCQCWVKGYYSHMTYADASGKLVGCDSGVKGTCDYCKVFLYADESGSLTNESRIVTWRAPVSVPKDETRWPSYGDIGIFATNGSPAFIQK